MGPEPRTFIVRTLEYVEGVYRVRADTEEEARAKFGRVDQSLIRWEDGVEQEEYMAFDVDVQSVEMLP